MQHKGWKINLKNFQVGEKNAKRWKERKGIVEPA